MSKFFSHRIFLVEGREKPFHHLQDAKDYCTENGIDASTISVFDSQKELQRWHDLLQKQAAGEIAQLQRQVEYELIPAQYEEYVDHYKQQAVWSVKSNREPLSHIQLFATKKEAITFCKSIGVHTSQITKGTISRPVVKRKLLEHSLVYTADFVYVDASGNLVVEDVKSEYTRKEKDYVIRRKLMLFRHKIKIQEIVL